MTDPGRDADVIQLRPVDDRPPPQPAPGPGGWQPVVPEPWQRHNLAATIRHLAGASWHHARWHGLRLLPHLLMAAWYAIRGLRRLGSQAATYLHVPNLWVLESMAVASGRGGHADAMRAHTERKKTQAERAARFGVCAAVILFAAGVAVARLPHWALAALGGVAVVLLARHGKPAGRPLFQGATLPAEFQRITPDVIVRALGSLGLPGIRKAIDEGKDLDVGVVQRDGPGWRAEVVLPYGTTVTEIVERREKLASGLHRPVTCVWPEPATDSHAGHLVLYVSDQPLRKMRQPAYPLAKASKFTLFGDVPFGTDQRGRAVTFVLMFANLLIGSIPRMGKTVALRLVLLACALDVTAELHVWELKGTGDCGPLEKVAHAYGSGADDATLAACLADTRRIYAELDRRAEVIRGLDRSVCPESKVTPELAAKRSLRLWPLVLAIDEVQEAFDSAERDDFEKMLRAIIKRGPALGIMLIIATQRPDAKSLPTSISANVGLRFCLRVMDQVANDMILGTSAYKRGISATLLAMSDKGCGWAVGFADEPQVVRTYNIDGPAAERVCDRARAARQAAGTLTGHAAGEVETAEAPRSFAADVLAVFDDDKSLWIKTIAERLAERNPAHKDIEAKAVAARLRGLDVPIKTVREGGQDTQKGCAQEDVEAVADV